jgi:hypothetical protein
MVNFINISEFQPDYLLPSVAESSDLASIPMVSMPFGKCFMYHSWNLYILGELKYQFWPDKRFS